MISRDVTEAISNVVTGAVRWIMVTLASAKRVPIQVEMAASKSRFKATMQSCWLASHTDNNPSATTARD